MNQADRTFVIRREDLQGLFDVLITRGYTPVGPTVRDGAIIYDQLDGVDDLPMGWTEDQDAGRYRLQRRDDEALFGFNNGPHSWKKYLFPPRSKLWEARKTDDGGFQILEIEETAKPFAFIGVRAVVH